MRKFIISVGVLFFVQITVAQKKDFSFDELFQNRNSPAFKRLPTIVEWTDDEHYLESVNDADGKLKTLKVDVKTGTTVPYEDKSDKKNSSLPAFHNNEKNVTASPDGKWIAYTRNNDLYAMELESKKEIRFTSDGNDSLMNGYSSWVYYEEILGRPTRYRAFWWSPDSKHLVFMHFDDSPVPVFPIYVSTGQHGYVERQRYPKAGDNNPYVKIGITSVEKPSITWADFNEKDDQYFGTPYWSPDGSLFVQWMNRGQDDLKIYTIDINSGSKKEIYDEKQATWIDLDEYERMTFLPGSKQFIIKSDKTGWMQLYLFKDDGAPVNAITQGDFTVTGIEKIDEKNKSVYFRARKENSARFDLYKTGLNGKGFKRLTSGDFSYDQISISPSGKYFIGTYSNVSTPTTMALFDAEGKMIRQIDNIKGTEFNNYNLPVTEIRRVKSDDQLFDLPVLITYPVNFNPSKRYPVLISIYGGPFAGTVYDRWRNLNGPFQWFAQEGLIQVSFDNRSSGHFGKKGMNFIHRKLGKYEIEDFMTCGRWLRKQPWVDTGKVCITGGSFGGYMTCMALTYGADVFNYGIANSSVTDWTLYDTHYTERYMDKPDENPEGYKMTSVLGYAEKYKGLLRITHGTSDDNVHMQNSIQLINKLEDLKKDFELMIYPGERHGFSGSKSRHARLEAVKFYYEHLLNKPMPKEFWESSAF